MIPDDYKSIETHQIALYVNGDHLTYFDSFGVEYIPNEIKKLSKANICGLQFYKSIICVCFWMYQFFVER